MSRLFKFVGKETKISALIGKSLHIKRLNKDSALKSQAHI